MQIYEFRHKQPYSHVTTTTVKMWNRSFIPTYSFMSLQNYSPLSSSAGNQLSVAFSWGHINGTIQSVAFFDCSALIFNLVTMRWDSASSPWEHELCSETASRLASMGSGCQSGEKCYSENIPRVQVGSLPVTTNPLSTPFTDFHPADGPNAFLPTNLPLPTATTMKDFHPYS